jgi:hypothetical protein
VSIESKLETLDSGLGRIAHTCAKILPVLPASENKLMHQKLHRKCSIFNLVDDGSLPHLYHTKLVVVFFEEFVTTEA